MRCACLKCDGNEDGYCCAPEGKVTIDENGVCEHMWIPSNQDDQDNSIDVNKE